jgi:hypothetical protein
VSILAIDPGNIESAYAFLADDRRPTSTGKVLNAEMRQIVLFVRDVCPVFVEMVASYGMPVGREVFETVLWTGRFDECAGGAKLVYRKDVAKDGNITHALVDRFAPGAKNMGKGTAKEPGWFYGFSGDIWQAYALGVYAIDVLL